MISTSQLWNVARFKKRLTTEFIYRSWNNITGLVFKIIINLTEGCCSQEIYPTICFKWQSLNCPFINITDAITGWATLGDTSGIFLSHMKEICSCCPLFSPNVTYRVTGIWNSNNLDLSIKTLSILYHLIHRFKSFCR